MSSRAESASPRGDSAAHNLQRIALRPLPVAEALALLAGSGEPDPRLSWHPDYPMAETFDALSLLIQAHETSGWGAAGVDRVFGSGSAVPSWWLLQIVLDGQVLGDVSFHGPPATDGPGEVEIGYAVVGSLRGRGIATRACALGLEVAWRAGAQRVTAETSADNVASQRVLERNGLIDTGDHRYLIERGHPVDYLDQVNRISQTGSRS